MYVASSAPRVCFPNVYGIDMPTRSELLCGDGKGADEVARIIGADKVVYQTIESSTSSTFLSLNSTGIGFSFWRTLFLRTVWPGMMNVRPT